MRSHPAAFGTEDNHTMKLSASHLKLYKQIATLLWKYGRSDLVKEMGIEEALDDPARVKSAPDATTSPDCLLYTSPSPRD